MGREVDAVDNRRADGIYRCALDLHGAARLEYLDRECGRDVRLRRRVDSLLASAESPGDPFEQSFAAARERLWRTMLADGTTPGEEDLSGQRVQQWRIARQVARGGLATVYLAHRDDGEFEQAVAIKVLRRGLDTDDVVTRFRAERQILSSLDHPSIARILDGGALPDGRPYLVLEYVDGVPITTHCRDANVDLAGRLRLVIQVLRALHHAHRHLVVHRDVKPSNVLVSREGAVKLLDFGIAKLLAPGEGPPAARLTRAGVILITPAYGSPEQHAGRAVTTASDVYQAGLLLYELLTGRSAFDGNPADVDFAVPPPSRALTGTPLCRSVRGDLDAITRKATDADPGQRYASADEMLLDLERFLAGLPVMAQPPTARYRLKKLAARKPWLIPLLAVAVAGVVVYLVTLTTYSARLRHEQRLAAAAQQFMEDLFRSPDPYAPADPDRGRNIRVVDALEGGQLRVRSELRDQPELRAALLGSISHVYASLDQYRESIALREEALALERDLYGPRSARVAQSLRDLGSLYSLSGDLQRADALLREHLEVSRRLHAAHSPEAARALIALGLHEDRRGAVARSRAMLLEGVGLLRADPTVDPQSMIDALIALERQRSFASGSLEFDPLLEAEGVARRAYGAESLQAALVQVRLASSMTNRGDYAAAEQNFLAAIPLLEAKLGENHGSTLGALNNLGYLHHRRGDLAAAERTHRELLARNMEKHGELHRAVGDSYQNLGGALTHQGRYEESIPMHRRAYEIFSAVLNPDNYVIAVPLLSIAYAELQRDDGVAAGAAATEAMRRLERVSGASHLLGVARCLAGLSLERQGRESEGGRLVVESHPLMAGASLPAPYPEICRLPTG